MIPSRKRTAKACDHCRRRKAKCCGTDPCSSCTSIGLHCSYGHRTKQHRGPAYVAQLEDKVKELETKLSAFYKLSASLQDQTRDPSPVDCLAIDGSSPSTGRAWRETIPTDDIGRGPQCLTDVRVGPFVDSNTMSDSAVTAESDRSHDSILSPIMTTLTSPVASSASETPLAHNCLPFSFAPAQSWLESGLDSRFALDGNSWNAEPCLASPCTCEHHVDSCCLNSRSHNEQQIEEGHGTQHAKLTLQVADADEFEMEGPSSSHCISRSNSTDEHTSSPSLRERNRVAAAKWRSKKKVNVDQLEADAARLEKDNAFLRKLSLELHTQQSHLRGLALQHSMHNDCCTQIP